MTQHISYMSLVAVTYMALDNILSHIRHPNRGLKVKLYFNNKCSKWSETCKYAVEILSLEWHILHICYPDEFNDFEDESCKIPFMHLSLSLYIYIYIEIMSLCQVSPFWRWSKRTCITVHSQHFALDYLASQNTIGVTGWIPSQMKWIDIV